MNVEEFNGPKIVISYINGVKYYVVYNNTQPVEKFTDIVEATKFKLELLKLKMENNKITQEELQQLQSIVEQYENVSFRIGQFTIEIESAKAERRMMIEQAKELLQTRDNTLRSLEEKYGEGMKVNIQTGDIVKE